MAEYKRNRFGAGGSMRHYDDSSSSSKPKRFKSGSGGNAPTNTVDVNNSTGGGIPLVEPVSADSPVGRAGRKVRRGLSRAANSPTGKRVRRTAGRLADIGGLNFKETFNAARTGGLKGIRELGERRLQKGRDLGEEVGGPSIGWNYWSQGTESGTAW